MKRAHNSKFKRLLIGLWKSGKYYEPPATKGRFLVVQVIFTQYTHYQNSDFVEVRTMCVLKYQL